MVERSHVAECADEARTANGNLPVLHHELGLGQTRHLPSLAATAIPENMRVTERHEPKCKVAPIKALRVPTDCNDRLTEIATGQLDHLATQAILRLVGKAAAQTREFEPDRSRDRSAPGIRDRVDDQRPGIGEERNKLGGADRSRSRRSYAACSRQPRCAATLPSATPKSASSSAWSRAPARRKAA